MFQRILTDYFGWLARRRTPFIKNNLIRLFDTVFHIDWDDAVYDSPEGYVDFNAFFSRTLKPGKRPFAPLPAFASPADGFISQLGVIKDDQLFQAKGHTYTLLDLLAGNEAKADAFKNGAFATLYLSPRDYHRVHTPLDAQVTAMTYVPGSLYPVNDASVSRTPNLFARNERLICYMDTDLGPMAIILVAALNVGSMFTPWHGIVKAHGVHTWDYTNRHIPLNRGDEVGGFLMGSTAIVLLPHGAVTWNDLPPKTQLFMGQGIGVCGCI